MAALPPHLATIGSVVDVGSSCSLSGDSNELLGNMVCLPGSFVLELPAGLELEGSLCMSALTADPVLG